MKKHTLQNLGVPLFNMAKTAMLILALATFGIANNANAANPWPYQPGTIINPACGPSDLTCTVTNNSVSTWSVGTTSTSTMLSVQGSSTNPSTLMNIASSSGLSLVTVGSNGGLTLGSSVPAVTANTLYNSGGTLMWGSTVIGAAGNPGFLTGGTISSSTLANINDLVGIGNAAPAYKLSVLQTAGGQGILQVGSTTNPNILIIDSNGKIGINTTSPASTFSVAGNEYLTGGLTLTSSTPATVANTLYANGNQLMWNGAAVGAGGNIQTGTSVGQFTY